MTDKKELLDGTEVPNKTNPIASRNADGQTTVLPDNETNSDSSIKLQSEEEEMEQNNLVNKQSDHASHSDAEDLSNSTTVKRRFAHDEDINDSSTEATNDPVQTEDITVNNPSAGQASNNLEEFSTKEEAADTPLEETAQQQTINVGDSQKDDAQSKVSPSANLHQVNNRRYANHYDMNHSNDKIEKNDARLPGAFYAGFWVRTAAYIFDLWMVGTIHNILGNLIWSRFLGNFTNGTFLEFVIYMATYLLYFILTNLILNGQTFGKVIFGLKMVSLKKDHLDWSTILLREGFGRVIFHYLSFVMFTLVFTERKQHVVDMLCDTSVVNLRYIDALNEYLETSTQSQPVLAK